MSKMSELSQAVAELRKCGEALITVSENLAELFSGQGETQPQQAHPETEPRAPTLEEVRAVLAQKSVNGHTAEIQSLIKKYGADKLSQIDPAHYASILAEAEALGNG